MHESKRLFFGAQVTGAWPKELPHGRILDEQARHLTLAFLGGVAWSELQPKLARLPRPHFRLGIVGKIDKLLFLPHREPRVVAGHVEWLGKGDLAAYQKTLIAWLQNEGYSLDAREFLPHVTLARSPFSIHDWKEMKEEIPLFVSGIHLYESIGNLTYRPLWSHTLLPPFEEFEHTADIAFRILGEDLTALHIHAQMALAFQFTPLLRFISCESTVNSLDDIVISLNALISRADAEMGAPFKAVSFHGKIAEKKGVLEWEMIVDV